MCAFGDFDALVCFRGSLPFQSGRSIRLVDCDVLLTSKSVNEHPKASTVIFEYSDSIPCSGHPKGVWWRTQLLPKPLASAGGAVLPLASASQGHTLAVVLFCLPSSSCGLASCGPPCLQLCTQDTHSLATHNKHTARQRTFQSHAWQRNCQNGHL